MPSLHARIAQNSPAQSRAEGWIDWCRTQAALREQEAATSENPTTDAIYSRGLGHGMMERQPGDASELGSRFA
jgi:hypothetical protein